MGNLLGAADVGTIIGLVVCVGLLVLFFIYNSFNRKKAQEQTVKMLNELKVGDKVVTQLGIYGEVVSIRETNMGKVVVLATGDKENGKVGYIEVNAAVIYGLDTKEDLILDENGDVIEPDEKLKEEVLKESYKEEKTSDKKPSEEKTEQPKVEEKSEKPKRTRKTKKAE